MCICTTAVGRLAAFLRVTLLADSFGNRRFPTVWYILNRELVKHGYSVRVARRECVVNVRAVQDSRGVLACNVMSEARRRMPVQCNQRLVFRKFR
jgi:hypothetical protein